MSQPERDHLPPPPPPGPPGGPWGPQQGRREPAFNAPRVILVLIGTFLLIHLYQISLDRMEGLKFLVRFAFIPARFGVAEDGGIYTFPDGLAGDIWTWFSYVFLHGDWVHLLFNSFWLLAMGSPLARRLKTIRFLLFFLICGALGAVVHIYFHPGSIVPTIGASASISGLMGAIGVYALGAQRFGETQDAARKRMFAFIAVYVLMNLAIGQFGFATVGAAQSIAWEAHLGGFFSGILLFPLFDRRAKPW